MSTKNLLLAIDYQNTFMDNGELGVPGANEDVKRACRFITNNVQNIDKIVFSLDSHVPLQIFHSMWWVNENNEHPAPFTIITSEDVENKKWVPITRSIDSLEYVLNLELSGKKQLCIWPEHALIGTTGHTLNKDFYNAIHAHSVLREINPYPIIKGLNPVSEMYGIFKPEYSIDNYINQEALALIDNYDAITVVGEAKSHCVLESLKQLFDYLEGSPTLTKKVYILEDCMSSIPGFEEDTEKEFEEFKSKKYVEIIKSTDLQLN